MSQEIALTLLQFVALTLPAIAIYMDISAPESGVSEHIGDGEAANYQNIRMAVLELLAAAGTLLIYLFVLSHTYILYLASAFIFVGIFTFGLAVLFDRNLLFSHHSIIWGYRNTYHRVRDWIGTQRDTE